MRKILRASILVLALCCPAFAGDALCPPGVTPPPPTSAVQGPTTDGQIDTGATAPTTDGIMGNGAAITFAQVILNLLTLS
jgi:hypothetical protein